MDMPWFGFSTTKIKCLRILSRLGLTPELLRRICACKASWNNRNNNWKKILTCGRALELTLDSSISEKILVVFWKSSPRRVRLGISIRCVAHELKSILMRRANSQYVHMLSTYVCMFGSLEIPSFTNLKKWIKRGILNAFRKESDTTSWTIILYTNIHTCPTYIHTFIHTYILRIRPSH